MTQELKQKMQVLANEHCAGIITAGFAAKQHAAFMAGAAAMHAELAPQFEWVDVNERLPEKDGNYLVKLQDGHCEVISYCVEHKYFMYSSNIVTHWRKIEL